MAALEVFAMQCQYVPLILHLEPVYDAVGVGQKTVVKIFVLKSNDLGTRGIGMGKDFRDGNNFGWRCEFGWGSRSPPPCMDHKMIWKDILWVFGNHQRFWMGLEVQVVGKHSAPNWVDRCSVSWSYFISWGISQFHNTRIGYSG